MKKNVNSELLAKLPEKPIAPLLRRDISTANPTVRMVITTSETFSKEVCMNVVSSDLIPLTTKPVLLRGSLGYMFPLFLYAFFIFHALTPYTH